jgi:competence protein ComEA
MRTSSSGRGVDPNDRAAQRLAQLAAAIEGRPSVPEDPDPEPDADATAPWWSDHTRVRAPEDVGEDPFDAGLTAVPEPGRHATRRRERDLVAAVRARLPETGVVSAQHLSVLALVVAVVIGGTAWWLLRDRGAVVPVTTVAVTAPLEPADAAPVDAASDGASPTSGPSSGKTAAGSVTVDVVGKVRRRGIEVLASGARVVDAIKAAGGARRGVDLSSLNLARVLVDGEQIAVGVAGAGGGSAPSAGGGGAAPPGGLVNLNTASEQQLEELPEVGPVTAQAILTYRQQNGGFTSIDQLLDVQGIGDKTMAQLQPYVTV